ncbi:MAG: hypothetical protein RL186_940, partial [Pseudomonadota bacterium]
FANIESQWPLFFTYLLLEAEMTGDARSSQAWAQRLAPLFQEIDGQALLPELYIVPEEKVAAEIAAPNSQERVPNANVPLLWAQSQWILGALLREGLLDPDDIDPLGRRTPSPPRAHNTIAVSLLAEDDAVKAKLDALGLRCAALAEDDAVKAKLDALGLRCAALSDVQAHCDVRPAGDLVEAWTRIGVNDGLGLSGRPARRLGPLANAILYDSNGRKTVFAPTLLEAQDYHIRYDAAARARRIRGDLRYIARHWRSEVPPVFVLTLDHFAMEGAGADRLLELLVEIDRGQVDFAATHLTTLPECFEAAQKLYPLGHVLAPCLGLPTHPTPQALPAGGLGAALEVAIGAGAADEIEAIYDQAGCAQDWRTARRAAAWLSRTDPRLQDCAKDIVVRLRRLDLGAGQIITRPINETDLIAGLHKAFGEGVEMVLAQEALQALGLFSKGDSTAVRGMQTIRLREILDCVAKHEAGGMDALVAGPPSHLFDAIKALLLETPAVRAIIAPAPQYTLMPSSHVIGGDYRLWRERLGVLTRVGGDFFARLWSLLHVCDGIVFGTNNRLDAAIARSDLTAYERDFALEIEVRLQTIAAPAYRTLCLEALNVLANCHERDKVFGQNGDFVLDDIIHAAVGQLWQDQHGQAPDWTHPQTLWDHALSTTAQTMARTLNQIVTKGILVRAEV